MPIPLLPCFSNSDTHTFITSKLDACNRILYATSTKAPNKPDFIRAHSCDHSGFDSDSFSPLTKPRPFPMSMNFYAVTLLPLTPTSCPRQSIINKPLTRGDGAFFTSNHLPSGTFSPNTSVTASILICWRS